MAAPGSQPATASTPVVGAKEAAEGQKFRPRPLIPLEFPGLPRNLRGKPACSCGSRSRPEDGGRGRWTAGPGADAAGDVGLWCAAGQGARRHGAESGCACGAVGRRGETTRSRAKTACREPDHVVFGPASELVGHICRGRCWSDGIRRDAGCRRRARTPQVQQHQLWPGRGPRAFALGAHCAGNSPEVAAGHYHSNAGETDHIAQDVPVPQPRRPSSWSGQNGGECCMGTPLWLRAHMHRHINRNERAQMHACTCAATRTYVQTS